MMHVSPDSWAAFVCGILWGVFLVLWRRAVRDCERERQRAGRAEQRAENERSAAEFQRKCSDSFHEAAIQLTRERDEARILARDAWRGHLNRRVAQYPRRAFNRTPEGGRRLNPYGRRIGDRPR